MAYYIVAFHDYHTVMIQSADARSSKPPAINEALRGAGAKARRLYRKVQPGAVVRSVRPISLRRASA